MPANPASASFDSDSSRRSDSSSAIVHSSFFEKSRDEYYDKLLEISHNNDWTNWCVFFLKAVESQARENQQKAVKILKLYNDKKDEIQKITHSRYSLYILDFLL